VEGLGRAIKTKNVEGRIQSLKLSLDGAENTHQQFVDDMMLQGIPIVRKARMIKQILNDFANGRWHRGKPQQMKSFLL